MNRYLIFRTDRIGDFLLSMILIKNIKRNDQKAFITVVCSPKNYKYIKTFDCIDQVYKLKTNFKSRFTMIKMLRKYRFRFTIVHDGKKRSKFINFFLKKEKTITVNNNDIKTSHFVKIKKIIKFLNFGFDKIDLDFLVNRKYNFSKSDKSNIIILHYDEKWSNETYIDKYKNIKPSEQQLFNFIKDLSNKSNYELIITTGIETPLILKDVVSKIYVNKVTLIENLDFIELESIISKSKLLISCHGAISHVASAHNIKQIDIIDLNKLNPYDLWTDHFRNYYPLFRKDFSILSKEIYNLV
jgi:ADP-heptose:LPS heptosyltransferase